MRFFRILLFCLGSMMLLPAAAQDPDEALEDPALEQRARELSKELRCVVCQNQSIDDSNAPLAQDLRRLVRERLEAGDTDAEVLAYVEERYGEFVLLRPRFEGEGVLLWTAPVLMLLVGGVLVWLQIARRPMSPATPQPLSEEELQTLARVMHARETPEQGDADIIDTSTLDRRTRPHFFKDKGPGKDD